MNVACVEYVSSNEMLYDLIRTFVFNICLG
ncbi:hypothetical protein AERO8C_20484 [Aeromonas veronii]|uniref:Uncharacterized protein n=1 Tax=Aeromonas veronii TaxID=654 RepID=A0A653L3A1_AERVE|nr:hypothetical protein AERO8C_20484 [Aeromonas veronii]